MTNSEWGAAQMPTAIRYSLFVTRPTEKRKPRSPQESAAFSRSPKCLVLTFAEHEHFGAPLLFIGRDRHRHIEIRHDRREALLDAVHEIDECRIPLQDFVVERFLGLALIEARPMLGI